MKKWTDESNRYFSLIKIKICIVLITKLKIENKIQNKNGIISFSLTWLTMVIC